jgi:hypothetical protein
MRHSPSTDQPTSDITAWFTDHRSTALTATYLLGFGATALLFFLEALRRRLRRDDDLDAVASVAFAGGIAVVFMVLLAGGMVAVLAFRPDTTAAVARALYDANGVLVALGAFPAATLVCASSVIALRASVFPRWFAWAEFVISALLLVGAASFQQSGAFKPQGDAGVLQATIAAFMLWLLAASVVMLRTTPSTEAVRPANQSAGIAAA